MKLEDYLLTEEQEEAVYRWLRERKTDFLKLCVVLPMPVVAAPQLPESPLQTLVFERKKLKHPHGHIEHIAVDQFGRVYRRP